MRIAEAIYRKRIQALDEEADRLAEQADTLSNGLKAIITLGWEDGDTVSARSARDTQGHRTITGVYRVTDSLDTILIEGEGGLYTGSWTFDRE